MTDLAASAVWVAVLGAGVGTTVLARRAGLSPTHARDLLHIGAGVWVLGWPWWNGLVAPMAVVGTVAVATALVPVLAPHVQAVEGFRRSVASDDEVFGGLVVYTLAFAVMTGLGLSAEPQPAAFPAAAALLALALGDGVGGVVGRRFGRRTYAVPWGKRKSMEGSVAVAVFATAGVALAGAWLGADVGSGQVAVLGLVAAVAEGLAPRGSDNAVVPAAVWAVAMVLG